MSVVLNDRDAILQAATVRIVNPKNAWINLSTNAPGFHLDAAGQANLSVVTVTAELFGLDDAVTFKAVGATLSNAAGRSVDVTYGGQAAIVTATVMSNGEKFERSIVIPVLRDGVAGATTYTWIKYADTAAGVGLSDDPTGKLYIGLAHNKPTATESTNAADYTWSLIKGPQGDQGVQGQKGADGQSLYTWIRYSDNADGTGLYATPTANTLYIGLAVNKTTATPSANKADYVWSRFRGEQGVAGPAVYTWIKYADTAAGAGLSDDPAGKLYIGLAYNKPTAIESTNAADYSWSLVKGEKGDQGVPGGAGADGQSLYTWIKYSDAADGTGLYDTPNAGTLYIGIAVNKSTAAESANKADYTWSRFKGDQGVAGPTLYTWIKYADSAAGAGISDDPTGKLYIGLAHNKTTATESTTASDYTWSLIKGEKGDQGVPGGKGADGQTLYTWVKYSDSADGSTPYDVPTDSTMYIGIAVNKTTATESTNKADYVWSRFRGADGVGTPGARGAGHYYTSGTAWSDGAADAATPGGNVVGDVVTISSGTFVMEKRWTGTAWIDNGVVIPGNLIVPGSVLASALNVLGLTVRKTDGTITFSIGDDGAARFSGNLVAATGTLGSLTFAVGGNVRSENSGGWGVWPAAGAGSVSYFGAEGMMLGNFNDNRYMVMDKFGSMFMPGLTHQDGQLRLDQPIIVNPDIQQAQLGMSGVPSSINGGSGLPNDTAWRSYGSFTVTPTNAQGAATVDAFINVTEGEMRISQIGNTIYVSGRGTGGANGTAGRSNSATIIVTVSDSKNRSAFGRVSVFASHGIIQ